ncbi:Putative N-end aminoacyl transferase, N-end rule aminoacyl transferase, acyl-CoA N-acyltransferase [Septoria linicola]|uniref:arginyltransferase n=1 Tax=Septoria linicola TaxID=215465 RepID=A0A9Q9AGE0_9PEZI|nr:putative N-end aminoacyl transferase, N-end rule aminoacyl transferase, acyl-CoA N-acyltransferase [Septoria linicola]USW47094.1 Putative N-end aminoacyl transferase, N-end rule aminoacyl transferase, acyl-CoA N-acyltransferase [Septoria linicola]
MQSSRSSPTQASLLTPIGYQSGDCGYCRKSSSSARTPDSRASYYVRTKSLSPEHYQELMDRGWRRSGSLLYLPDAARSCCTHYTIRLPVSNFTPTKDQRQALNRWNRFVLGDEYLKTAQRRFPKTRDEKRRLNSEFDLLQSIHESEISQLKPDIQPSRRLEVTLEPDQFSEEKFALFDNYQRNVHHEGDEDISKPGFKRFLCGSPLARRSDVDGKQLGSFHQCYRLDGRLVAMAVLDLLPHAVSGVYFLYHQDFEKFSFGKLSALREAALALEQEYKYYYMGYYIHSCKKMRYKADYKPQFVLDPHGLDWQPLDDDLRALMECRKYASTSLEQDRKQNRESDGDGDGLRTEDTIHPLPVDAMESGLSIMELGMPGVLTAERLQREIDLDHMKVFIGRDTGIFATQHIVSWDAGNLLDAKTLKGIFAELAAAIGPVVAREAVIDFT